MFMGTGLPRPLAAVPARLILRLSSSDHGRGARVATPRRRSFFAFGSGAAETTVLRRTSSPRRCLNAHKRRGTRAVRRGSRDPLYSFNSLRCPRSSRAGHAGPLNRVPDVYAPTPVEAASGCPPRVPSPYETWRVQPCPGSARYRTPRDGLPNPN